MSSFKITKIASLRAAFLWSDPDSDQWYKICLDNGVSKKPVNPLWSWVRRFLWCTMILRSWITDPDPDHPRGTQVGHYFYNKPGRVKKSRLLLSLFLLPTFRESTVVVCIASFMCFHSCVLLCINIIAKKRKIICTYIAVKVIVKFNRVQSPDRSHSLCDRAFQIGLARFSWLSLQHQNSAIFSIDQLTWLQERRDPVQELFRWQTSPRMPQLIKWKRCLDSWVKLKKCTFFLSKIYTLKLLGLSLLNITFIIIPCIIYIKFDGMFNSSILFWLFQGSNDSPRYSYASLLC